MNRLAALVALVLAAVVGVNAYQWVAGPGFVTVSGGGFILDGKPFRFVGFNLYDAAATDAYSCRPASVLSDRELDAVVTEARDRAGATVIRFWAYQPYTDGGTRWDGMDRVIRVARAHGLRLLPVLEDGPGDCTTAPDGNAKSKASGESWYVSGYRRPWGSATLSYRDYVERVVTHYRDEPVILGWSMVNEADTTALDSSGRPALVNFARDVGGLIHEVDRRHPVTVGTQGNGAPGASGPDFAAVYGVPEVDFAEVHDWGHWGDDEVPMPGSADGWHPPDGAAHQCRRRSAPIGCSFSAARSLGKPLVVGEAGIEARDRRAEQRRSRLLLAKIGAAFAAGAAGYLVWQLNPARTDGYDVDPGSGDPLLGVMRAQALTLGNA